MSYLSTLPFTGAQITTSDAMDYTRQFFASHGQPVTIHGATRNLVDGFECRDVLFILDGHSYRMTCWIERPEGSPAYIYGEW
jgi:hypothetical protein